MYQTFDIDEQERPEKQKTTAYKFSDKYSNFLKPNFINIEQQYEYHQNHSSAQIYKQNLSKQMDLQMNPNNQKSMKNVDFSLQSNSNKLTKIKKREEIKQEYIEQNMEQIIKQSSQDMVTPANKANILFLYEDEEQLEDKNEQQNIQNEQENIQIPKRELREIYGLDQNSDNQNEAEIIIVNKASQYFNKENNKTLISQILACIEKSHVLQMQLKRQNSGLNMLWPQYELRFKNQAGFLYAKRTTARPVATYIFSLSPKEFEQTSQSYVGKLKTNIIGNTLYIYGPGLNPKNAEEKHVLPRQMVATIVYQTSFMNQTKPRSFSVYVRHPDKPYYSLNGTKAGQQIGLDQLYLVSQENRENITLYRNSKPQWNQKLGGFMLNFKGRVRQASVKNFILQDMLFNQVMMFGKMSQNKFSIQVQDRFSPLITFGIALSAFDSKFLCQ